MNFIKKMLLILSLITTGPNFIYSSASITSQTKNNMMTTAYITGALTILFSTGIEWFMNKYFPVNDIILPSNEKYRLNLLTIFKGAALAASCFTRHKPWRFNLLTFDLPILTILALQICIRKTYKSDIKLHPHIQKRSVLVKEFTENDYCIVCHTTMAELTKNKGMAMVSDCCGSITCNSCLQNLTKTKQSLQHLIQCAYCRTQHPIIFKELKITDTGAYTIDDKATYVLTGIPTS